MTTQEKLSRLKSYGTRYELAITHPDGRRYLICYTPRKGRSGIWDAIQSNDRGKHIADITGDAGIYWDKRAADGGKSGEWSIRFTGRTQRDAILEGELTYIGHLEVETATAIPQ